MATREFNTRAVHAGETDKSSVKPTHTPIYQTNTFYGAGLEDFEEPGNCLYTRISNPNQVELEEKYAALHGGRAAVVFSSGMGAISSLMLCLGYQTRAAVSTPLYAGTYELLRYLLPHKIKNFAATFFGTTFFDKYPAIDFLKLMGFDVIYLETPGNPTLTTYDIEKISKHARLGNPDTLVAVDNTFATPVLQRPLELGADIVIESLTKYAGDDGTRMGGAVVLGERTAPLEKGLRKIRGLLGTHLDPTSAALISKAIKTMPVRVAAHEENAKILVSELSKLRSRGLIGKIYYPNFGGMVSFELAGGQDKVHRFAREIAKTFVKLAVSLGSSDTMIAHPSTMLYHGLMDHDKEFLGINYNLFRVSVGLEDPPDICQAFKQALETTFRK